MIHRSSIKKIIQVFRYTITGRELTDRKGIEVSLSALDFRLFLVAQIVERKIGTGIDILA